jgi:general stress protein YciG
MSAEITGATSQSHDEINNTNAASPGETELTADPPPRPIDAAVRPRRPRGFAAMDRKLVSEIARKGGKAAHTAGTAHEFTSDEARAAGSKGGRATHAKRRKAVETHQG